ncbi:MAG: hydroxylamine reductase [Candidatus Omnitrophota bacterium]
MFCRQCEQTAGGKGCTVRGVCGKDDRTAVLQNLLVHLLKEIGTYATKAGEIGVRDAEADRCVIEGLFATVTNVDFDPERLKDIVFKSYDVRERIKGIFMREYSKSHGGEFKGQLSERADWKPAGDLEGLVSQGKQVGVMRIAGQDENIRSLREILLYGLKGMAAYADHAAILGKKNEEVNAFFHKGLSAISDDALTGDDLVGLILELGKVNLKCMELLDEAHTGRFGHPVPSKVFLGSRKGPAILVSGHDLLDLEQLLQQTEGKGVNIYTHGEMLPAHGYPGLKRFKHLAGNYGGAWQDQRDEFDKFPGAILMTTNCLQEPKDTYKGRIFTTGLVAWPGVRHIDAGAGGKKDLSPVIEKALEEGGFPEDEKGGEILVGFAHNAVLGAAARIVEAVKTGAVKHFFLIGGCDGAKPGRNYYTEFAEKVPKNCVILTLACGKYRFNKMDFGYIGDIPRLLDCGQCNDAYSAIKIAAALAEAFKCTVNELPLSLILSWYEQKAVCILLTLLSLGIKNIKLGPSLPAFISPDVLKVLVDKFNIQPVTTPDEDLKDILG